MDAFTIGFYGFLGVAAAWLGLTVFLFLLALGYALLVADRKGR